MHIFIDHFLSLTPIKLMDSLLARLVQSAFNVGTHAYLIIFEISNYAGTTHRRRWQRIVYCLRVPIS